MTVHFSKSFLQKIAKLKKRNSKQFAILITQIDLFQQNQRHPSLKLHKLRGQRSHQYAIWIQKNLRALCVKHNDTYIFIDLVTHDQY